MSGINNIQAEGQIYDILAPEIVNDYVEKLGKTCINPNGYTKGSLILATDGSNVQRLYKTTSNISSNQVISEGGNVELKKLEDLFDDLEDALNDEIDDIDTELGNVKQALSNEVTARAILGAHNIIPFPFDDGTGEHYGLQVTVAADGKISCSGTSGTSGFAFYLCKNYTGFKLGNYRLKFYGTLSANLFLYDVTASTVLAQVTTSNGSTTFSITAENVNHVFNLYLNKGPSQAFTVDGGVVISLASDTYDVYTAPSKTNTELTKDTENLEQFVETLTDYSIKNGVQNLLPNELKSRVVGGITVVVDSDGVISLSGTADYLIDLTISANVNLGAGTYKLSGTPSGGGTNVAFLMPRIDGSYSESNADMGSGKTITASSGITAVVLRIRSGANVNGLVFKPTIVDTRVSTAGYSDFVPFGLPNGKLTSILTGEVETRVELGAHQLIPYPYYTGNNTNGNVTFTVDDEGVISATSSGTPTGWYHCMYRQAIAGTAFKVGNSYTISGGESGINVYAEFRDSSMTQIGSSVMTNGTPVDFTIPNGTVYMSVFIYVGTAVSNKKIKPLITVASDTNRVFTPYAKSNKELTDKAIRYPNMASQIYDSTNTLGSISYTATKPCWVRAKVYLSTGTDEIEIRLNTVEIKHQVLSYQYQDEAVFIPLKAGDTISITADNTKSYSRIFAYDCI